MALRIPSNKKRIVKSKVKRERIFNTYAILADVALFHQDQGATKPEGSSYQFMTSLIFSAFTLEAYLNHVGMQLFKCWSYIERKLSPEQKLHLIAEKLEIEVDKGKRPFQTIIELMHYRNALAHGKPETLSEEDIVQEKKAREILFNPLEPKWQEKCDHKNAKRAIEDVDEVLHLIHESAGLNDILFDSGSWSGTSTVIEAKEVSITT